MSQFQSDRLSELLNNKDRTNEHENTQSDSIEDKDLFCTDCKQEFIWTVGEQSFFRDKGLKNPPKRCKPCKKAKTHRIEAVLSAQAEGIKQKIEVIVDCAKCGDVTTVPFYPSQGRPVYCRSCYIRKNPDILKPNNNGNSNQERNSKQKNGN